MSLFVLNRKIWTPKSTIGRLFHVNYPEWWWVLEDVDRWLEQGMDAATLKAMKVPKETAIPYGTYGLVIDWSNRFKKKMPHILDVPAFEGIRIHKGNFPGNTEGCPLTGKRYGLDAVFDSGDAYDEFFPFLEARIAEGPQKIKVMKDYEKLVSGVDRAIASAPGTTPLSTPKA